SLVVLYRLLFMLKAEAQDLLPMRDEPALFDAERHPILARLKLHDDVCHVARRSLLYLDPGERVPYEALDVRDLGSIYEGLLEQRVVRERQGGACALTLRSQSAGRKSTGSYFTPDSLVDQVVRSTLLPLLESCGDDAGKVLDLKIVDPAMGSGHFLVKVVDIM